MSAAEVFAILQEECGANDGLREDFLYHWPDCGEYRFQGWLGFGGKCYEPNRFHPHGWVSCYPEDTTEDRMAMMMAANDRLDAL